MNGYLLDTNIVSELYKRERASPRVRAWYNRSGASELFISVLVLGEIRRGIESRRLKDRTAAESLENRHRQIEVDYQGNILPVTAEICDIWGRLSPRTPLATIDGLMAATALHHRLTVVTRNTKDFLRSGAACFNPFLA